LIEEEFPLGSGNVRQVYTTRRVLDTSGIFIGCSGWQYKHWRADFYPADLPQSRWLEYYAERFNTVEINNTFYRLPEGPTFAAWRRRAPRGFVYAVKASRFLTHMKKLKDPDEPIHRFFTRARQLRETFGPILYQLPPRWPVNLERLDTFLRALPRQRHHAIEFRDPSWYADEVLALLRKHRIALCLHDMAGSASGKLIAGPFVYVRFHGVQKYSGSYSDQAIDAWARWLADRVREGLAVYAYFNNDTGGHAPRDAVRLRAAIASHLGDAAADRRPAAHGHRGPLQWHGVSG
jgi:uncharacterized protein YecE (DUF72 family)